MSRAVMAPLEHQKPGCQAGAEGSGPQAWDVITGSQAAGSLWLGYGMARRLADAGQRVRLFTDEVQHLACRVDGVVGDSVLQCLAGLTISHSGRADEAWPAATVLQVLGAPIPSPYLQRLLHHPDDSRWMQLESLEAGRGTTSALTLLETHLRCRSYLVQIGDAPHHAGYLHSPMVVARLAQGGMVNTPQEVWLSRLGLGQRRLSRHFTVFVEASASARMGPLLRLWRQLGCQFCVLMETGNVEPALALEALPVQGLAPEGAPMQAMPQIVALPLWTWTDTEGMLQSADLVIAADPMQCLRIAALGVPLIPLQDGFADDDALLRWYCEGAPPGLFERLCRVAQPQADESLLRQRWADYWGRFPDMTEQALGLAQRISRAPDLAATLLGAGQAMSLTEKRDI